MGLKRQVEHYAAREGYERPPQPTTTNTKQSTDAVEQINADLILRQVPTTMPILLDQGV